MIRFSEPLPLRTTAAWPGFREARAIPHRYGITGGACLQYNADRTQWVWADHECAGVDAVFVDGQQVSNWQARAVPDAAGHTVTMIEFDAGIEDGAAVTAHGRGKLSSLTGRLLDSPADVVHDLIARVAGRALPSARLDSFRAACARAGLLVGGSITEAVSLQSAVREVCASVGAIFAPDARGLCHLWPDVPGPTRGAVDKRHTLGAELQLDALETSLTLLYAHEDGTPTAAVEVEARESAVIYGRRPAELQCPWVRSARVAAAVAARLLEHRARPTWAVSVSGLTGDLRVGDAVTLDHPTLPAGGVHTVLERVLDPADFATAISLSVPVGAVPVVRVLRQSSMLEPEQYSSATVVRDGADYLLTLREEDGRPIAFAAVTLDGQITRTSDGAGRVRFPATAMTPGEHSIAIVAADGRTLALVVTV